jgi:flagellar basal-body rod protein FlgG
MTKDAEGFLATDRGNRVLGQTGPIYVGDNEFTVEENGALRINGLIVDRLVIVDFENKGQLSKAETGGFRNEGSPIIEAAGDILQGYLESSNVDLSEEMTNLIEISNKFTTHQRLIQMMDEISSISSNRLGKV